MKIPLFVRGRALKEGMEETEATFHELSPKELRLTKKTEAFFLALMARYKKKKKRHILINKARETSTLEHQSPEKWTNREENDRTASKF
mmetsp:Transcript_20821/g.51114  ORF Transcript_20821/g.51114 Transcript_20821/m.51114 type:complete len:89 (+) Transcript_20821:657-923(+)|eukprot:CAMPEP_0113648268 /NCGR_PEP_ID=MMETSP0017_2-20120614/25593_1 /TAXON_ID=2856 /ORGANISM="Cylindrotheca closterium" /LENGTH=88 /DNA_ID=CAMNT_0000560459 /DNA_START=595 /DNA_END=861 /DNA_ORIENTATION=- /assembly_acc=CAM_ASM_000147